MAANRTSSGIYPDFGSIASSVALCSSCYMMGTHSYGCPRSDSFSYNNLTAAGGNEMAYSNGNGNNVIEVVLLTEDEEGDQQLAFGPKAFAAANANAAVAKATGEFVAGGGDASKVVNALTRFFG